MEELKTIKTADPGTVPENMSIGKEIDLHEIAAIFKKYRWLMLGVVFFVSLLTVATALLLPRVYRAEIVINPPLSKDVEQLKIFDVSSSQSSSPGQGRTSTGNYLYEIMQEDLYDKFIRFLGSKQLQHVFFKENNLFDYLKAKDDSETEVLEVFHKKFSDKIGIYDLRNQNKNDLETVTVTLDGSDEELLVEWLNKYVVYVNQYTIESIISGINTKAKLKIEGVDRQIQSLRDIEKSRRLDLVEQYKEAIQVAELLGFTNQVSISFAPYGKFAENMDVTLDPGDVPLYLRGSKALQAELNILQQRKSDDPFISGLRDLQQRLAFLSHLSVENFGVHAANIDQFAFVSGESVKPNRKLIVVIGFLFGCLLALFTALVKNWQDMNS